ncbi:MAG TPA: PAS domain S-box protein, partial [Candidatus Sulfotelmatobacter sp.]|nr:PAS domain S-box protein [Candidatus Sulfotelmatobacter sp.]
MSMPLDEDAITYGSNDGLAILNSLPGLVWTTDETGVLCYANSRFTDFTGLMVDQGGSRQWASFLHPDDHLLVVPEQMGGVQLFAARLRRRDGQFEWFNLSASPMKGLGGEVCWLATELLERIDNQNGNADRDFLNFLDSLSLQALLLTPSLELEFANQAACQWYGLSQSAEVQDRSAHFNLSNLKEIAFHLQAGQDPNETAVVSYQGLSAGGTLRWLEAQVVQIRSQNGELAG